MSGSIIRAWDYSWQEIWQPLREHPDAPKDLFMELYPQLVEAFGASVVDSDDYLRASNDSDIAEQQFSETKSIHFKSERLLYRFVSDAYSLIDDFGINSLTNLYVELLSSFTDRYNLRFRVKRPFLLVPDIGTVFASVIDQIAEQVSPDPHLNRLKQHLQRAFDLLVNDGDSSEIHKLIAQACIYAEGLAGSMPGLKPGTLGDLIKEMEDTWPHAAVREAVSKLYGFCSSYPSIRHSGNPVSPLRELQLRDGVLISMVLLAFSGYFVNVAYTELLCIANSGSQASN